MFFLPKCYKRLEEESSLLKNSGWCEENFKNKWFISLDLQKKKQKNSFQFIWKLTIFLIIIPY